MKEKVLDIAKQHYLKLGSTGISLNAILKEAGCSKGFYYHHFPEGKLQILREVAQGLEENSLLKIESAWDASRGNLEEFIDLCILDDTYFDIFQRVFSPQVQEVQDETMREIWERLRETIIGKFELDFEFKSGRKADWLWMILQGYFSSTYALSKQKQQKKRVVQLIKYLKEDK